MTTREEIVQKSLALLRMQLYTAAQTLEGKEAEEFWGLIEEIRSLRGFL